MTDLVAPSSADELRRVADAFWDAALRANPTFATIMGDRRFDDRLEDLSPAARAARMRHLQATLHETEAIDPASLDETGRVTRSMLLEEAGGQLAALRTGVDEWSLNPIEGPQTWLVDLIDYQQVRTPEDGEALVTRWRSVGRYLDQAIDGLRRGVARGCVPSIVPVQKVADELRGLVETPPAAWRMAAPAGGPHPDWPAAAAATFRNNLVNAIAEVAGPAFARYLAAIDGEILPVARSSDQPGLLHVPGGEAAYLALARAHTTLDIDPEAVHQLGLAEIERIDGELADLGARVLGVHGLPATLHALRDDPSLRFTTADEVFHAAEDALQRAEAAVPRWFGRLPRVGCDVIPMPMETAPHQTLAYYDWPALDGSRPGHFRINLYAPETRPRYEAQALAFHEAVPGHHTQMAIAQELPGLPEFQRALGSNAFSEGWALYTERLADEMGLYASDLDRFGMLSYDAWRACRLVVDTGMHALGWTRDAAIEFMTTHTALARNNIENEVDRYIAWPAQALAYKLGQLEIRRLRAEAERRLGARFDIRDFHDTVLGSGAVGLQTLDGIVTRWLARREAPDDGRETGSPG